MARYHPMLVVLVAVMVFIMDVSMAFKISSRPIRESCASLQLSTVVVGQADRSCAVPSATKPHNIDDSGTDLTALIGSHLGDQSEVYTQAVQLLTSMQSSPSCNRLAASTLLTSCQSIEGSKTNAEGLLDDLKSVYAAQLAVCELTGAGSPIPQHCASLMWSESFPGKQGLRGFLSSRSEKLHGIAGSRDVDQKQLNQCLKSLESRPQWWTSYSNSRQNAVVMCQAARIEIDKGLRHPKSSRSPEVLLTRGRRR